MIDTDVRTATATAPPTETGLVAGSLIIAGRTISSWRAQPGTVLIVWLFPVLITLLFIGLFGGAIDVPTGSGYADFLMPGMLAVAMLFGLETTTLSVAADASRGINDRLRSLPINSASIVLGRCVADVVSSLATLALLLATGFLLGWRPDVGLLDGLVVLALLLLLRFALLWVGIYVGYGAASVESVAYVQILVWPIAFLSSVFVDPSTMPNWLGTLAEFNPVSATATAIREAVGGGIWAAQSWAGRHALALASAWPVVLTALFLPLAALRFRKGAK
ncbi:ABC transporter permease [Micromonospora sonneratiae]|uniref:Transport permease protein n=1 Tax=Micromonospora sonneratiae TaxID=1184706 RepID=A0ABW3YCG3_9ACTN